MVPRGLGTVVCRPRSYGLKVWFDLEAPPREHYEAQVIGAKHVPGAKVLAIEVGFHAEHSKPADNAAALGVLVAAERKWRRSLGQEAVAGPFLGRDSWARISETWIDPDLGDPELGLDIGTRLVDYVLALEPLRKAQRPLS
jgi:hypothetical protein